MSQLEKKTQSNKINLKYFVTEIEFRVGSRTNILSDS